MNREAIRNLLRKQPFEPFRVVMSNGETYDVRHPDATLLLRSYLEVMVPGDDPSRPSDRVARLSLRQIASIEDLQAA